MIFELKSDPKFKSESVIYVCFKVQSKDSSHRESTCIFTLTSRLFPMMTPFLLILLLASSTMAKSEEVDLSSPHHLLAHLSGLMENITALSNRPHLDQAAVDKMHKAKVGEEV